MKLNNHYIFGDYFYSYQVEFWGDLLKNLLVCKNPIYKISIGRIPVKYTLKSGYTYKPLTIETVIDDIRQKMYLRRIFTRTTIRHFNYYMEGYFGTPNAYQTLINLYKIK